MQMRSHLLGRTNFCFEGNWRLCTLHDTAWNGSLVCHIPEKVIIYFNIMDMLEILDSFETRCLKFWKINSKKSFAVAEEDMLVPKRKRRSGSGTARIDPAHVEGGCSCHCEETVDGITKELVELHTKVNRTFELTGECTSWLMSWNVKIRSDLAASCLSVTNAWTLGTQVIPSLKAAQPAIPSMSTLRSCTWLP